MNRKRIKTKTKKRSDARYETVKIVKIKKICPVCENYSEKQASKPVAVICCEGACLRGEVARRAADILCQSLVPRKTVRICLGGAFTKDTGQRKLVRNAKKVVAIEGCFIKCASRMMKGVIEKLKPEVVLADNLYDFDRSIFGTDEMSEGEINRHARKVAMKIAKKL